MLHQFNEVSTTLQQVESNKCFDRHVLRLWVTQITRRCDHTCVMRCSLHYSLTQTGKHNVGALNWRALACVWCIVVSAADAFCFPNTTLYTCEARKKSVKNYVRLHLFDLLALSAHCVCARARALREVGEVGTCRCSVIADSLSSAAEAHRAKKSERTVSESWYSINKLIRQITDLITTAGATTVILIQSFSVSNDKNYVHLRLFYSRSSLSGIASWKSGSPKILIFT